MTAANPADPRLEALLADLHAALDAIEHLDDELRLLGRGWPAVCAGYAHEGIDQARKGLVMALHAAALVQWAAAPAGIAGAAGMSMLTDARIAELVEIAGTSGPPFNRVDDMNIHSNVRLAVISAAVCLLAACASTPHNQTPQDAYSRCMRQATAAGYPAAQCSRYLGPQPGPTQPSQAQSRSG